MFPLGRGTPSIQAILREVAMHCLATLLPRSIKSFNNLAASFVSQFAANKVKRLEVVNLFDIRLAKVETLKSYLARFNNATVQAVIPEGQKGEAKHPAQPRPRDYLLTFTLLREKRAQILQEIYHTRLLKFPKEVKGRVLGGNRQDRCEFHNAYDHSMEECWTL
ncbi:hypothetical protein CR513_55693, partial [Mucuna pruriens]